MSVNYETLLADFRVESAELLEAAEARVLELERDAGGAASIDGVFRAIHTIKGNAGIFELKPIIDFAHDFESYLNEFRDGRRSADEQSIDFMLTAIDRLRILIADPRAAVESFFSRPSQSVADASQALPKAPQPEPHAAPEASAAPAAPLRIPAALVRTARERGRRLTLVQFDAAAQPARTLRDFAAQLERLRELADVELAAVHSAKLPPLSGLNGRRTLPYYLLLSTAGPAEPFLKAAGIVQGRTKLIYDPAAEDAAAAPAPASAATHASASPGPAAAPVSPVPPASAAPGAPAGDDAHFRVPIRLIETLLQAAGEAVVARNELLQRSEELGDLSILGSARRLGQLVTRLQENLMRTRLQELNYVFQKIPRIIRDAAQACGKRVAFEAEGGHVELDRTLLDSISESLLHLIRNAVDHGIETPEERARAGKNETGRLRISAALEGGNVTLVIEDDGRGLDFDRIRARAIERGLVARERADLLSESELTDLIFMPGFSTAERITETSGRGVGMDVVRERFRAAGGSIAVTSERGRGSRITALLPQTLSITVCLMVLCGKERYAIPRQNLVELALLDPERVQRVNDRRMYNLRGRMLPLISATALLYGEDYAATERYLAVVRADRRNFALSLDDILNPEEAVIRPLSAHLSGLELYAGGAIAGDGEPTLILDPAGVARRCGIDHQESGDSLARGETTASEQASREYLLFSYGETTYAIDIAAAPRIFPVAPEEIHRSAGREVARVRDDLVPVVRLDALFRAGSSAGPIRHLLLFACDGGTAGIAAEEALTVAAIGPIQTQAGVPGLAGRALWNDRLTLVVEPLAAIRAGLAEELTWKS